MRGTRVTTFTGSYAITGHNTLLLRARTLNLLGTTLWNQGTGRLLLDDGAVINNGGVLEDQHSAATGLVNATNAISRALNI